MGFTLCKWASMDHVGRSSASCRVVDEPNKNDSCHRYEAAFGKKPDLSDVHELGDKVWVHLEVKGFKLGRVREGHWMGISDELKGICVYWPDKKTISTERNIYFNNMQPSVSRLEGEEWEFVKMKSNDLQVSSHATPEQSAPQPSIPKPVPN